MLPKGLLKEYSRAIIMMVRLMDMMTILFAGWVAYIFRFSDIGMPASYLAATMIGLLLTPIVFSSFDIYTLRGKTYLNYLFSLVQATCVVALILICIAFFTKTGESFSRTWFILWMMLMVAFLMVARCCLLLCMRYMRARGLNERRVLIVGLNSLGLKLVDTMQQALWTGFNIVQIVDDHLLDQPPGTCRVPVAKTPTELNQYLTDHDIDEIWLALPLKEEERVKQILFELRHSTITTRFVLDIFSFGLLNHSITDLAGFPVLNIRSTPMSGVNRLIKAMEDRIIATLILVGISPLLLLIAIGVKLSSRGPVFFKQQRLGCDGRVIEIYKFRTMYLHEEKPGQVTQATANDQRITRFGRWLRRLSLDELPQFINVLQGRMSIVGPRPHALAHNELYKDSVGAYMQRHRVKPGITGWAQVNGWRGETDTLEKMQKRVECDLYYIENWSLLLDLKIIFLTFFKGFVGRNAY